jgi:restriction endonuclease S subunit
MASLVETACLTGPPPYQTHSWDVTALSEIFTVTNGINTAKMRRSDVRKHEGYIPLVRPSRKQTGSFVEYVDKTSVDPRHIYPTGTLYVSTNGQGSHTYAYVAPNEFVPNSDVSVLQPKRDMGLQEKLFYALSISRNRRLFSYGRKPKVERLSALLLPRYPPPYVYERNFAGSVFAP